jgi:hypothetical protein
VELVDNCVHKLTELNEKIVKIKEFYLYCKFLKKPSSYLSDNIEKYF